MRRCAGGGIIWSSAATKYQLGLVFQAGSVIVPLSASTPQGTWESAMNSAFAGSTSAAKAAGNLALSRNQISVLGRENRRNWRPGRRILDQARDRFPPVRSKRSDVNEPDYLVIVASFGNHYLSFLKTRPARLS